METQAWFKIVGSEGSWDEVSLEGIKNVARVRKAIKKEAAVALDGYDASHLMIKATYNNDKDPENAVELDPEAELHTVLEQVPSPLGASTKTIRFFITLPLEFGMLDSFFNLFLSLPPSDLGITYTNTEFSLTLLLS